MGIGPVTGIAQPIVHVVDDEQGIRELLTALLSSVGHAVRSYAGADDFLAQFKGDAPGCLLLDVRMPGRSGLQLQEELAARKVDLPIIFMSAHADVPTVIQAMKLGAVHFVEKPFNHQHVIDEVNACLARHSEAWLSNQQRETFVALFDSLTERQRQVARLIVTGVSSKEIGRELNISNRTVDAHRGSILAKFGVHSAFELAHLFHENGVSSTPAKKADGKPAT
jgi:FixJ family two-component response regulator